MASSDPHNSLKGIKLHPEEQSNAFSKFMVFWINPLIRISGKRQLSFDDVWEAPSSQSVQSDSKIVWDSWLHEVEVAAVENRDPSLTQALFGGFGTDFYAAGGLQAVFMFSQLSQPYLIGELVKFIQLGNGGLVYGAGISIALLVVSLISSISFTAGFFILRRLGVSIRSGVMMAVYEKALKLTSASRMQNTIGQTTNLMSIDAEKLFLSAQFLHFIWHGPIANIIVMTLIIQDVGVGPGLLGLASQLALLPLQNYLADSIGKIRRAMVNHTDERVKLMNEILQSIRVIKVYAWEVPMEKRVMEVRSKELRYLNIYLGLNSALRELLFIAGPFASIVVFTSLTHGFGQSINLVQMFRVTAFINVLRLPSSLLGQALKNLSDARVSAARLTRFFELPTLPTASSDNSDTLRPLIEIKDATFRWDGISRNVQKEKYERTFVEIMCSKMTFRGKETAAEPIAPGADTETDSSRSEEDTLKGINIVSNFPGELIALIGSVGSGKSSLISALLKEIPLKSGISTLNGRVAYCAQTPWIQNLSLRDNVLFGGDISDPIVAAAYQKAIHAAALTPDLAILSDGDLTEIGERGINLSGGQKARVSIARALLAARTAQIVLLDDPFSAVDGATGNWIFEHGILEMLKGRIRVIALNSHRHLLSRFDRVIVLDKGQVVADGSPGDMTAEMLYGVAGAEGEEPPTTDSVKLPTPTTSLRRASFIDDDVGDRFDKMPSPVDGACRSASSRKLSVSSTIEDYDNNFELRLSAKEVSGKVRHDKIEEAQIERLGKKLISVEIRKVGDVSLDVYNKYFAAAFVESTAGSAVFSKSGDDVNASNKPISFLETLRSIILVTVFVLLFAGAQFVRVAVDYSLARWAEYGGTKSGSTLNNTWNIAYFVSFGALFIFLTLRSTVLNYFAMLSASHIHKGLFRCILCAPVTTFFDTHTMGEILNRFSKDTEIVDSSVPEFMMQAFVNWAQVFSVLALSLYATPYFAAVLFPLILLFYNIYIKFGSAQRDLKRLEAVSRSPVYASLSETLSGLETIRAYGATDRFLKTHLSRMDFNQKFFFHLWMCTSWLTARLEISTSFILFSIAILCVSLRSSISPVALGLALTYGLQLNALFQRVVQVTIDIMSYMISTERVLEYCEIDSEPSTVAVTQDVQIINEKNPIPKSNNPGLEASFVDNKDKKDLSSTGDSLKSRSGKGKGRNRNATTAEPLPPNWPSEGIVQFENVWMQYRDNPAVLKGISFKTQPAMRIGICGRTGAGKSSLMVALLRMSPIMNGAVYLDGVNIATVPLQKLRSVIAIIPQDPVIFTGTIRFQLDPFSQYSDLNIWEVLEQVNMSEHVRSCPLGLNEEVYEGGENLSQGQRQLLCIARALLRDARVLIMDEGTSAVDPMTDELIQKVLRDGAARRGTTVLTIAHRLETIIDFDRILVLGEGVVLEFDTPQNLLQNKQSIFSSMVAEQDVSHT